MRYRSTRKWDAVQDSSNLLYFAQLIEELLFDFSLDTYKPSAMNTSLLCKEALETIFEIDEGNIKKPNLQHILDELCVNLSKDIVSNKLINLDSGAIFAGLKNPKSSVHDKKVITELLARQTELNKYKSTNEDLLKSAISCPEDNFSEIRSLTRSYITTLINSGYSSKHIFKLAQQYFYYGSNRISSNEAIQEFLAFFSKKADEYHILYRGSPVFESIAPSCSRFDIAITKDGSEFNVDISKYNFALRKDEVYISITKVNAKDVYVAKQRADERLELLSTLYTLFHHKEHLPYLADCLVINNTDNSVHKSKTTVNTMHKCIDHVPVKASSKLNKFVSDFSLERTSFKKFTRSAELHSLALASDSTENQMINLWIAIESIIPAKSDDDNISNIEHIINSLTPFLSMVYLDRLIARLTTDLLNWNKHEFLAQISGINGSGLAEKLVKLMALSEYEERRNRLIESFNDFHLLSDRFNYFCDILSSPANVASLIDNHNTRVSWQIRRIYRARNLIVHSGKTPSYTKILIENTHDYLDVVMGSLMKLATKPKEIQSIEQGFKYAELSYLSFYKWLSAKGAQFDDASITRIIDKKVI
ncbi:MAG: hypothetical protein JAZ17_16180 [Candidatus Thiodiazotropha endolucinida]|nr:hypothetical protein [Candidatus Thiodiazotropha endolucinida]